MGAVFTITLFSTLWFPILLLEWLGIDATGYIQQAVQWITAWVAANPDKVLKIREVLEGIIGFITDLADKF